MSTYLPVGQLMKQDIESQADSLAFAFQGFSGQVKDLLDAGAQSWRNKSWIFTGCGTTFALSHTAASMFQRLGILAAALPASEISFYPELIPSKSSLLVAFSRSGETSETLWAVESFRKQQPQGKVLVVTASPGSILDRQADFTVGSTDIRDSSTIETKSFTGMLYLAQLLSAWISEDGSRLERLAQLPDLMSSHMSSAIDAASLGRKIDINRFFFLGSGETYGLACQAAFTMKECSGEWVEAFHPLEFRHGPRTTAIKGSFVCLFLGDEPRVVSEELRVIMEMKNQGAITLILFDHSTVVDVGLYEGLTFLNLQSGLPIMDRLPLYMPFVQWLAYERALARNLDPDHPVNLNAVTKL